MNYDLYLKYNGDLDLNIDDYAGGVFDTKFANIMHFSDDYEKGVEDEEDEEDDEREGTKIGFISWIEYNHALATTYGLNMSQVQFMTFQYNSKALMELDYTNISKETIDEIGATSNPNIIVLLHFGISAAWRHKGIGEQVLKGFIKQMKGKYGYIFIARSRPEQCGKDTGPDSLYEIQGVELAGLEKDPEKAQWKINAFWQKCGFRSFKNYENVFVCNIEQAVPDRIKPKYPEKRFL